VIRLRHFEQQSAKEVGDAMGLTQNAVNVLFHRAQKKLMELVVALESGGSS
jgi:DNA-directed RNA polymerase specialized sigma24 family protein